MDGKVISIWTCGDATNATVSSCLSHALSTPLIPLQGNYVRYAPNSLLFNTADGLKDIYGHSAHVVKSTGYTPMVHRAPNTLTIRGGKDHSRRRRIMAHGVSEKAQRGYEPRIMEHINKLCDAFLSEGPDIHDSDSDDRAWSSALNMADWCNYLSFDIMADVVFGAQYNLIGSPRFRYVCETIDQSNVRMGALIQAPRWAALKLDKYIFRDAIRARNRFVKFVVRVVQERMDKPPCSTSPDLFANLAVAKDPETNEGFRPEEIGAESATLIVAGSDTTSTSIASVLFYLAHCPRAYARAAAEVRRRFATRSDIAMGPTLASCTYLRACIDEAMRISPPVGSSLWREVMPGGTTVDGHSIPAGCDVGVPIYSIHHSPKYFDEPFQYRPERWIVGEAESTHETVSRARAVFNPFSLGMRGCLGKGLAMTELMLSLASILHACDFKLADGKLGCIGQGGAEGEFGRHREDEYQLFDHVTSQKQGPWLCFSPRSA